MVSFSYAVRTCIVDKYAVFRGRASRSEFWWFVLFASILSNVLFFADSAFFPAWIDSSPYSVQPLAPGDSDLSQVMLWLVLGEGGPLMAGLGIILLVPSVAVTVRRLHDINLSGWWYGMSALIALGVFLTVSDETIVGGIIVGTTFVLFLAALMRGTRGYNDFGVDPLG